MSAKPKPGLDDLDYYELLGVDAQAGVDAIRAAFHAFARRYHPDNHTDDPKRHERATQIFRRGTEAYRVLLDRDLRFAYDGELRKGIKRLRSGVERRHASRIPKPLGPRARTFFAAAEQAQRGGDLKAAILQIRIALQHEPGSERLEAKLEELELLSAAERR
ncbi:MAG: J domain-containing protein [Deltaproteobacteria bacterium]|nr:J domain-containing protein [Deltaproteobacteria bacterium]